MFRQFYLKKIKAYTLTKSSARNMKADQNNASWLHWLILQFDCWVLCWNAAILPCSFELMLWKNIKQIKPRNIVIQPAHARLMVALIWIKWNTSLLRLHPLPVGEAIVPLTESSAAERKEKIHEGIKKQFWFNVKIILLFSAGESNIVAPCRQLAAGPSERERERARNWRVPYTFSKGNEL